MKILALLLFVLTTAACVSKSKHEGAIKEKETSIADLQAQLDLAKTNLSEANKQIEMVTTDKKSLRQNLEELASYKRQAEERIAEYKKLNERFKKFIDAGKLSVKIVRGRMVVALSSDILFKSGSAKLSPEGEVQIEDITRVLIDIPDREFQIEGHTDNVPIRTSRYTSNWSLGADRALAVFKTMEKTGFPKERASIASFADTKPVGDNGTDEGKSLNRRIEIVVIPDLEMLPGNKELE